MSNMLTLCFVATSLRRLVIRQYTILHISTFKSTFRSCLPDLNRRQQDLMLTERNTEYECSECAECLQSAPWMPEAEILL
jgi:hypothetical protein